LLVNSGERKMPDDPLAPLGWAAPTFSPIVAGTIQPFPFTLRVRTIPNNHTKREVHFKLNGNHWYDTDPGSNWDEQWYDIVIPEIGHADFLEIHTRYVAGMSVSEWGKSGQFQIIKQLTITSPPQHSVVPSAFVIAGTGALGTLIQVTVGGRIFRGVADSNGTWSADVTGVPRGNYSLHATHTHAGVTSKPSLPLNLRVIDRPVILSPGNGAIITETKPIISGTSEVYAWIKLHRSGNPSDSYGSKVSGANGKWEIKLEKELPWGSFSLAAEQSVEDVKILSNAVALTVSLAPVITEPPSGSLQSMKFTLSGTSAVARAMLTVHYDLRTEKVGEAVVPAGNWSLEVDVKPGPVSLVAMQTVDGVPSGRSAPRTYFIRPPVLDKPVIGFPDETTVTFSGNGHYDPDFPTRIQLTVKIGQGNAPAVATVQNDGTWATSATGWELGSRTLVAIQQIYDNAGGWIDSLPVEFEVENKLPPVSNVSHTDDYQPTFSGKGVTNATVRIWLAQSQSGAPDVVVRNGSWSTRASSQWGPTNNRKISIQQTLNGFESRLDYYVSIAPREPGLDVPPEVGLTPIFSGTCYPGALVNITFSDSSTSFGATVTGDTWIYQRQTPFTDGVPCTIEATQTVVGLASKPVSLEFKVYLERLKPAIRTPLPTQETDSDLTVTGDFGMAGASMQLWDLQEGKPLGDPVVLGQDGPWSVRLTGLAIKTWFITAQQTLNDRASPDSEVRQFDVVVMPPEFVRPLPGGDLTRTAVLSGTGRRDGLVTVWRRGLDEPLLRDVQIGVDGTWEASVVLEVGDEILWATQTFEGRTSKPSRDVPCRVVPVAVTPESPTPEEFLGATVTVSGFGVPGDLITLKRGECVLGTAPVLDDASWSIPAALEPPDGAVSLSVVASKGEFHSAPSEWECQVRLFLPQFTYPTPGVWVSPMVIFTGLGKPGIGTLMSWYSPDVVLAGPITVTDTGWTATPTTPLRSGAQWCRFRQISSAGAPISDDAESGRFDVRVVSPDNA
jgi:hypothetical protein